MAKSFSVPDDSSIPYRVIIDFLEGTLRKKDAIAFARGFIEQHFDSVTASGYYVAPYEQGYIFEAHEGGHQHAYLPGILQALEKDPGASVCVQMARRVMEVKRSPSGNYTAILLPEGTEPQNPEKIFPEAGPPLIPFQRSGLNYLVTGGIIFSIGFLLLVLTTIFYLVQVSGLLDAPLPSIDVNSMPLGQWQSLKSVGGETSDTYIKTLRYQNGSWQYDKGQRQNFPSADNPSTETPAPNPADGAATNPLAPPTMGAPGIPSPGAPAAGGSPAGTAVPGPGQVMPQAVGPTAPDGLPAARPSPSLPVPPNPLGGTAPAANTPSLPPPPAMPSPQGSPPLLTPPSKTGTH